MRHFISALFLISCFNIWGQQDIFKTTSENVQTTKFTSKNTGDTYTIDVSLPFGYANSERTYPVLYALDGNVTFGMVNDITKLISFEKPQSAVIVVGVSYTSFNEWITKRGRDLMPSFQSTHDIDKYLAFISNELVPTINQNFRSNESENIIYGHSSAAIFGFYAMMQQSKLFKNYILTSPSVDEDGGYTVKTLQEFLTKQGSINITLFNSVGRDEKPSFLENYSVFSKQLKEVNTDGFQYTSLILDGTHMSTMAPAFVKGFEFIFDAQTEN